MQHTRIVLAQFHRIVVDFDFSGLRRALHRRRQRRVARKVVVLEHVADAHGDDVTPPLSRGK